MSSPPKTANTLTKPGTLAAGSPAPGAEIGAAQHRFHQCLGLLKEHTPKTRLARPISTSDCASKSATKNTGIYNTIRATTSAEGMFPSSVEKPFLPPRPNSEPREASNPSRSAAGDRVAARAKRTPFTGARRRVKEPTALCMDTAISEQPVPAHIFIPFLLLTSALFAAASPPPAAVSAAKVFSGLREQVGCQSSSLASVSRAVSSAPISGRHGARCGGDRRGRARLDTKTNLKRGLVKPFPDINKTIEYGSGI